MILGIPKEILENETRIAAIPATIKQYIAAGFKVIVESGAGLLSQISDDDFKEAGAEIIPNASAFVSLSKTYPNKRIAKKLTTKSIANEIIGTNWS